MPFRRLKSVPALALALSALLTACGGGTPKGDTTPPPPAATYKAGTGVAQKGPLAIGATVTAQELGLNLSATGSLYSYATTSATGAFTPNSTFASALLSLSATGRYADEATGNVSDGPVTLQSYANLGSEQVVNVNVLTTLAYTRTNALLNAKTGALAFADARAQAEREVLAAFGVVLGTSPGAFGSLDESANTDGGHLLAALSAVVVQGRTSAQVGTLLTALQADIAASGAQISSANAQSIALSEQALNLNAVATHLGTALGTAIDANTLAPWIDQDGDGVIGRDEFRVDDATPASTVTLPVDWVKARDGAAVTLTAGQLVVNGAVATQPATIHAGDTVAVAAPASLPDGALKVYVRNGSAPIARVTFVKGLTGIAVTPSTGTLPLGISQRFVATGTFADGHSADISGSVTWTSSAPAVADIGAATGLADALTLGNTTLTATSGSVSGAQPLTTVQATIRSMVIAPAALQTGVGITRRFVATGTFSDGSTQDVSASATWATQIAGIAAVSNGAATGLALGSTSVTATLGTVAASAEVDVTTNTWTAAAMMPTERVGGHSATLLTTGKLLVAGGVTSNGGTAAVDLYDPVSASWSTVAPMGTQRSSHAATLLADGRVLVTGGSTVSTAAAKGYVNNVSAEIYDPVANTWTPTAPMTTARSHHTATLLPDGTVLVVGGENDVYLPTATAELYDPVANTWSAPRALPLVARSQHTATLLPSGLVLIAGGFDIVSGALTPANTAELYDPVLHTSTTTTTDGNGNTTTVTTITGGLDFTATTPMTFARYGQSATRLADGRVVMVGGQTTTTEIYDPVAATWATQGSTTAVHTEHAAVLLADGRLLVVGGTQQALPTAELFDPATGVWTATAPMRVLRSGPTATLMPDGSVLACGGAPDLPSNVDCETFW